ncbi:hypothetical protein FJZ53_00535 [Candidatus Woesearchaeota archaeon]|nr:hypothetical protein [Candidatus Woesearchaeota archaeon]
MGGEYHERLDKAMEQYRKAQFGSGKNLGTALERAYNSLTVAIRYGELTPWQKESHARNLELLVENHNQIATKKYFWKTASWITGNKKIIPTYWITGRKLKREIKKTEQVKNECQRIQEEAIREGNEAIRCEKHTY